MLNGNVAKPDDTAYIATRIECFHIGEALSPEKSYTSYVKIQNSQKKDWATADVYVFQNDRIVALCSGLKFQRMPKTVLDHVLGKSDSKAEGPPSGTRYPLEKSGIKEDIAKRPERSGPSSNLLSEVNYNQEAKLEEVLLAAVAAETGVELDEMDNSMKFADIGVDSMMSIAIISSIKKKTGIDLGASFFTQHPTVAHIREALWEDAGEIDGDPEANSNHSATSESNWNLFDVIHKESTLPPFSEEEPSTRSEVSKTSWQMVEAETPKKHFSEYTSNVVLLQGRASAKQTPLFLICDGAGSAAAYIHLPIFGNGMEVYALESPFLNCPSEYTTTVEESAQIYVSSLRKVQPQGPYMIGGWSAGAVFAYEVSRLLLEAGQTVLGLIIIDMRVPRPMPDLEAPMSDVLENVGLVTGINRTHKMPSEYSERLKKHLLGCIKSLMHYDPLPMHRDRRPNYTTIIWATLSIAEVATEDVLKAFHSLGWKEEVAGNVMEDEGTGVQAWFFSKRKSFGANGWDALLGEVECHTMEADHFSMLSPPRAS
jgi:thioesterase domain-containing protein/acyl carrier protein